ncbi:NAD(P)/FAD-dependent oxidoreductase [Amycolatopsis sp. NPDC058278]|uniref:NAD(P)/FAD-dependent oxidoreductase n=1 Tax=Amycolatopsis sp. NPDC058278 TaxID=3346417 RepID=UPI0036DDD04D
MRFERAVVLGGGLAGMLAAAALARHCTTVTIVERDRYPDGPAVRQGTPQAHHAHLLMEAGARAIDDLVPGALDALYSAGARKIGLPEDVLAFTQHGWQTRFPASHFLVSCSRPLLDQIVRRAVLGNDRIVLRTAVEATKLLGDASRVTGAELRSESGAELITADFLVDATGRASRTRSWLLRMGLPPVKGETVDSGLAYATRVFRAPDDVRDTFPLITVMADPESPEPGRNGVLLPVEDGRWIVTVSGTRGAEPPSSEEDFLEFARGLRHPLIADVTVGAEPLGGIHFSRSTVNRRLHYGSSQRWPEGIVVAGDALAAFNPIYGHGMSCAAMGAKRLDTVLESCPDDTGVTKEAQRAISLAARDAWVLATGQDLRYPGVRSQGFEIPTSEPSGTSDKVARLSLVNPAVSAAVYAVNTLTAAPSSLNAAEIVAAAREPIPEPPAAPPAKSWELGTAVAG